ncbi:hypothetical protein LLG96_11225 [bacterium]|nr:hypothetical protein [bacterium]
MRENPRSIKKLYTGLSTCYGNIEIDWKKSKSSFSADCQYPRFRNASLTESSYSLPPGT